MTRVAIVEDHKLLRSSFVALINDEEKFHVEIEASNGQELLNMINSLSLPDIVLVDVEMPIMDGPETVLQLRSRYGEDLKILGLSIHTEVRLVNQMLENGANGYLSKAAGAEELFTSFEKLESVGFYLSKDISRILKRENGRGHLSVQLNEKEIAILKLLFKELTNSEIAATLEIPVNTVNTYRTRMIDKLGVRNTVGLVLYALKTGICKLTE